VCFRTFSNSEARTIGHANAGAGNAFLGEFTVGYLKTKDVVLAAQYGTVAASFALEQIGVPNLHAATKGQELWNGIDVQERLREFQSYLSQKNPDDGPTEISQSEMTEN